MDLSLGLIHATHSASLDNSAKELGESEQIERGFVGLTLPVEREVASCFDALADGLQNGVRYIAVHPSTAFLIADGADLLSLKWTVTLHASPSRDTLERRFLSGTRSGLVTNCRVPSVYPESDRRVPRNCLVNHTPKPLRTPHAAPGETHGGAIEETHASTFLWTAVPDASRGPRPVAAPGHHCRRRK